MSADLIKLLNEQKKTNKLLEEMILELRIQSNAVLAGKPYSREAHIAEAAKKRVIPT